MWGAEREGSWSGAEGLERRMAGELKGNTRGGELEGRGGELKGM